MNLLDLSNPRNPFTWIQNSELSPPPAGVIFPEFYNAIMGWRVPIAIIALYVTVVETANSRVKVEKLSRVVASSKGVDAKAKSNSSPMFTSFIILHNAALCIYSAWTFYHSASALRANFASNGFWDAFCDKSHNYWNGALGLYGYYFYLSKYWEILDTIIILLKGRRSSLLQTYHHSGAILTMWAGINYSSYPIWIFVVFNSLIHTIMYFYYAVATMGYNPPFKQNLTQLQITQFVTGQILGLFYLAATPKGCIEEKGGRMTVWWVLIYSLPLLWLFVQFARRSYGGVSSKGKASAGKENGKKE